MKKIISLALVLCLVFALAPAAYASSGTDVPPVVEPMKPVVKGDTIYFNNYNELLVYVVNNIFFSEAGEGIFGRWGHLTGCTGNPCQCLAVMVAAEKEQRQIDFENSLQVWIQQPR